MDNILGDVFNKIDSVREDIRLKAQEQVNKFKAKLNFNKDSELDKLDILKKEYISLIEDNRYTNFIDTIQKLDTRLTNDMKNICQESKSKEDLSFQICRLAGAQRMLDVLIKNDKNIKEFIKKLETNK